ncbi:hypothetical protein GGP41_010448 [Bipolaris sorokiniana]|uniref:Uncharacterized protein n=1 Tax=Cochliobolus sativus TaxID=45130 RepID=A0A8H5ZM97_COCSA|nr:hypothetical protein GGP41_010448 [Bipolaris sorokiniana]
MEYIEAQQILKTVTWRACNSDTAVGQNNFLNKSIYALTKAYNVLKSTLYTRLYGIQPRSETASVNRKLSAIEEQSLVQYILDLNRRGFPPYIINV